MKKHRFASGLISCVQQELQKVRQITPYHLIPLYSAHASYFLVLAAFPLLLLILGLIHFTPLKVESLMELMEGLVPEALLPTMQQLIVNTYEHTSTTIVSVSAVAALWSASRSVYSLVIGLNTIYGVKENRCYLYTRMMSVVYMFLFLVVLGLTLILHVFGQTILTLLDQSPIFEFFNDLLNFRFLLLLLVQTALFTAVYSAFPNRKNPPRDCLPGAVFASIGWQGFSYFFSLYVEHFSMYSSLYGSVYAVALSMLWLYACVFILFLGGAINRLLMYWEQHTA